MAARRPSGRGTSCCPGTPVHEDADRFQSKLTRSSRLATPRPQRPRSPQSAPLSDAEVNCTSIQRRQSGSHGVVDRSMLSALGEGRVSGRRPSISTRFEHRRSADGSTTGLPHRPIAGDRLGSPDHEGGKGQFVLQSAEISGVTVPRACSRNSCRITSRTPENPAGIDMDARRSSCRPGSGKSRSGRARRPWCNELPSTDKRQISVGNPQSNQSAISNQQSAIK